MIGICVLTIAVVLGSLGITNSITSLQNVILMKEIKKDVEEMKKEIRKDT